MAWTRTYDQAEPQRVNRWLAQSGVCSRREAEALIGRGLVSIDGAEVKDAGHKIHAGQTLTLADTAGTGAGSGAPGPLTVLLHKPMGVVSGQPEPGQVPAARLLTRAALVGASPIIPGRETRLPPAGRLDRESRGLLVLSSDGVVAKAIIGPASQLDKEYQVVVRGVVSEAKLARLGRGLELDGRPLKPAQVTIIGDQRLRFVLREGRNRQIRRMCDLVGLEVVDLQRLRIGPLRLDGLPEGRWRVLGADERRTLLAQAAAPAT